MLKILFLFAVYAKAQREIDELNNKLFHYKAESRGNISSPTLTNIKLFLIPNLSQQKIFKISNGLRKKSNSGPDRKTQSEDQDANDSLFCLALILASSFQPVASSHYQMLQKLILQICSPARGQGSMVNTNIDFEFLPVQSFSSPVLF